MPDHKYAHFKAGYSNFGRVVVANNSYDERDFRGDGMAGRLAEWDGGRWRIIERAPFIEVNGRGDFSGHHIRHGLGPGLGHPAGLHGRGRPVGAVTVCPKGSHCFDHMWQTEWPRIREVEHERFLMDCHGIFYELSPWAYGNRIWAPRPISTHLWVLGDFCAWRGLLVLGADNASPHGGANHLAGEPQSGLWFGKTDDLWGFGKPAGQGGPWWRAAVRAGEPSDPYLMSGFEHKTLHLRHDADSSVRFRVEVDFMGDGEWAGYTELDVAPGAYVPHVFPTGYSAHWGAAQRRPRLSGERVFHLYLSHERLWVMLEYHPLSEEDRRQFYDEGYLIVRNALDGETVSRLIEAGDRLMASDETRDRQINDEIYDSFRNVVTHEDAFIPLITHSTILPLVMQLFGSNLNLSTSHLIYSKTERPGTSPDKRAPGWHRDNGRTTLDLGHKQSRAWGSSAPTTLATRAGRNPA